MAINIKNKVAEESAHGDAAAAIETEIKAVQTNTELDPSTNIQHADILHYEKTSEPVQIAEAYERIEVGTSFKMPVASYTMLEFSVKRSVPYLISQRDPDEVFEEVRAWVETKINKMIEDQQTDG